MAALIPDETILGLIAIQTCHGYELVETFRNTAELGDVWKMSTSQVYAVLKRLEQQALITGHVIESETAPSRTEYRLTAPGTDRFEAWLNTDQPSASIRRVRVEFLSRLYIARQLNQPTIPIVLHQKAACRAERERLVQERDSKRAIGFLAQTLHIAQLDAVLQWIDQCELVPHDLED